MATDWNVPKPSGACSACGCALPPGAEFWTQLFLEQETFRRSEFCLGCGPQAHADAIGQWRGHHETGAARPHRAAPAELLALFESLEDAAHPQSSALRFALGLVLWRSKALRLDGVAQHADGEVWQLRDPGGDRRFAVRRPALDEAQIESLGTQLERVLTGAADGADDVLSGESTHV